MKTSKTEFRNVILTIFTLTIAAFSYGQKMNQKEKLSFHSFSFTPEIFFIDDFYAGGFGFTGDVSWVTKKDIFTFSVSVGEEFVIWGSADSFQQLNLLFGRELMLKEWFFIDAHAGVGFLFYNTYDGHFTKIGMPLIVKMRFKTGDKFSIGPRLQANINSQISIYSAGLLLQWNYL